MTGGTGSRRAILGCVALFSTALGVNAVVLPLRALEVGFGPAAVGYFGGIAAAHQIGTRLLLPWVLRRVPDRWLMVGAGALVSAAGAVLLVSATLAAFVVSAALLGLGRALFWTASQVHVLRGDLTAGRRTMSYIQFLSAVGELAGPTAGGALVQVSSEAALWLWVVCGAASVVPAVFLERFPPLGRADRHHAGPVWRRRGVIVGCAAAVTAGGWRALLSSLVPAVLADLGRAAGQIGVLVSVANAASVAGAVFAGRVHARWVAPTTPVAMVLTGAGIAAAGLSTGSLPLLLVALATSGVGGGILQTIGPVLAAGAVGADQRGDAVVMIGLARSAGLMLLPPGVGLLVGVMAAPLALAVGGVAMVLPVAAWLRPPGRRRR